MTQHRDFLDEIVEERTRRNPDFPALVEAAEQRRAQLRQLAHLRSEVGLSQTAVAATMRTSQSVVARIESGEVDVKLSTLEKYAAAVGKRLVWTIVDKRAAAHGRRLPHRKTVANEKPRAAP